MTQTGVVKVQWQPLSPDGSPLVFPKSEVMIGRPGQVRSQVSDILVL